MRRSPFFRRIIAFLCSFLLSISRHYRGIYIQCEVIKFQIIKYPRIKIFAHPKVFRLCEFTEKSFVNVLSGRRFPVEYLPQRCIVPRHVRMQNSVRSTPNTSDKTLDYRWCFISPIRSRLRKIGFRELIEQNPDLPQPGSNRGYKTSTIIESFIASIWCGANRFLHTEVTRIFPVGYSGVFGRKNAGLYRSSQVYAPCSKIPFHPKP